MNKILVLHGPNLNLLGRREPNIYGQITLNQINDELIKEAEKVGIQLSCTQNNCEGALITSVHQAIEEQVNYLIINPAGYTHTSIALRDALCATAIPFIEVHLSNIYAREPFRQHSYFSDIARGVISGLGWKSYLYALHAIIEELQITRVQ